MTKELCSCTVFVHHIMGYQHTIVPVQERKVGDCCEGWITCCGSNSRIVTVTINEQDENTKKHSVETAQRLTCCTTCTHCTGYFTADQAYRNYPAQLLPTGRSSGQ